MMAELIAFLLRNNSPFKMNAIVIAHWQQTWHRRDEENPGEGFKRPGPPLIEMDAAVNAKVEKLFNP